MLVVVSEVPHVYCQCCGRGKNMVCILYYSVIYNVFYVENKCNMLCR